MERKKCNKCGTLILSATFDKNLGLCALCVRGYERTICEICNKETFEVSRLKVDNSSTVCLNCAIKLSEPRGFLGKDDLDKMINEIIKEKTVIILSDDFKTTFPLFSKLVSFAEITEVKINDDFYRLFTWRDKNKEKFGWLGDLKKMPIHKRSLYDSKQIYPASSEFLKEHILFIENVGGIAALWDGPEDENFMTWGKDFIFSLSSCYKFKSQETIYHKDSCWIYETVKNPLDISKLLCFSQEGNGNMTFYNTETSEIFLLLTDHSYEYVTKLEGHPEYSFYTINGVKTFVEYVELLAKQFLSLL